MSIISIISKTNGLNKAHVENMNLVGDEAVLELGCGTGSLSKYIAKKLDKGGYLTCADISDASQKVLKKVLKKFININYCFGDIRMMNIDQGIYDKIIFNFVLNDISSEERSAYIDYLLKLLKINGKLYIRESITSGDCGISSVEIRRLMREAHMLEENYRFDKGKAQQTIYSGIFKSV